MMTSPVMRGRRSLRLKEWTRDDCLSCFFNAFRTVLRTFSSSVATALKAASIESPMSGWVGERLPVGLSSFPLSWRGGISMLIV